MTRKNYLTLLSVISAIAVVCLHTNGCFWAFSKENYWFTANIIECVFFFAVPIFFMITGVTLIDYQEKYSTKEYFKKRINKTFIPFIIWSIIGLLFNIVAEKSISINDIDIKYIFNGIFSTSFTGIYWFFISLFIIYLCIPLFASVEKEKKKSIFLYLIIVGIIFNSLLPFINNVFNLGLYLPITVLVASGYLIYPLLGYLLDRIELTKKQKIIIYIVGIIGLLMHIIGTYILSMDAGKIIDTYKGYTNIPCIIYSVAIFVLLKDIGNRITNYKIINVIGKYTFPIYLMHWYVLRIFVKLFSINTQSILYRLGAPFIIVPICMLIAYFLRKIPLIKKCVP